MDGNLPGSIETAAPPPAIRRGVSRPLAAVRPAMTFVHRWAGLVIAGFLFISGVTGAVISWDHELDDILNPHLMYAQSKGPIPANAPGALELAQRIEAKDPEVLVTFVPLAPEPGGTLAFGVSGKRDPAAGKLFEPGYNQVFIDPANGAEQGRREWGAVWPITPETFVSFLYVLHYTLHIPPIAGIDRWGVWLLGVVAVIWTLDCLVGFYLTLPPRQTAPPVKGRGFWARWKPAWLIKTGASAYRINFDIHRAFGLWLWGVLFTVAFTAFSLNLYTEVFYPVLSRVSKVTPDVFEQRTPKDINSPIMPTQTYAQVLQTATAEGAKRSWEAPAGSMFYSPEYGIYGVGFHTPGGDHGAAGVGPPYLYYDGLSGKLLGDRQPWVGTPADIFVQAQFPLHSGRILGIPGRILISITGLVVAALSVTGVVIWAKKRKARVKRRRGQGAPSPV